MRTFESKDYKVFELFAKDWAVVTAGTMEHCNQFTVSWGSFGTLWSRPGHAGHIITIYGYPTRYSTDFLKNNDYFTVGFFAPEYKKALAYIGSHSGREVDKIAQTGLTLIAMGEGIGYKEAKLTFVCKKLYQQQLQKEGMAQEIKDYYAANPNVYHLDENGRWNPHFMFVGEIVAVEE